MTTPSFPKSGFNLNPDETAQLLEALGEVLQQHMGQLPEMVLIVRRGETARTFFAGLGDEHPVETMRTMLEQALVEHNRRHPKRMAS